MDKNDIKKIIKEAFLNTEGNLIGKDAGYEGEAFQMYDEPLIGFSSASDELYAKFKQPGIIGPDFMTPQEWLSGAKTVVSMFFPASKRVRQSNAEMTEHASLEWMYARIEGQSFMNSCVMNISKALCENGIENVVPLFDKRFGMSGIVSNWSERHVAFVSGLGTFGMSRGLITAKGMAGRFASFITTLELEPDKREYTDVYEYCIKCGACAKRCPANAFNAETGLKDNMLCYPFVEESKKLFAPRYGCGLCQTNVPCQDGIPGRNKD